MIKRISKICLLLLLLHVLTAPVDLMASDSNDTSIVIDCGMQPAYSVSVLDNPSQNPYNPYPELKNASSFNRIGQYFFITDTYHDQVIYTDNMYEDITKWRVMATGLNLPHGVAGDGQYYLVLDTDNNRVLVYEWIKGGFRNTQGFDNVGERPHYIVYDSNEKAFYVWSSMTGDMYIFVYDDIQNRICIKEIRHIYELEDYYVRSFTMLGDYIIFPSGTNQNILKVKKDTFEVVERYPVNENISGMAYIFQNGNYWYASVSTDYYGNQNNAKFIRTADLSNLENSVYEDISQWFPNMGVPYYMEFVAGKFYLTNHGTVDDIYGFSLENDCIADLVRYKHK